MTTQTFYQKGKEHYPTLPEPLKKAVDLVEKATKQGTDFETYKSSEVVTRTINLAVNKLNEFLATKPIKAIAKQKTTHYATITKKTSTKKTTLKKDSTPKHIAEKQVELLPEEIKVIKRFLAFDGKVRTAKQISALIDYVQKAAIEKRIRKTSEYADEIMDIQRMLIKAYNTAIQFEGGLKTELDEAKKKRLIRIVTNYEPLKSVALVKQYISLDNHKQTPQKAKALWEKMNRFVNDEKNKTDKHIDAVIFLMPYLSNYYTGVTDTLAIKEVALNGILPTLARFGLKFGSKTVRFTKPIIKHTATHLALHAKKAYQNADAKLKKYENSKTSKAKYHTAQSFNNGTIKVLKVHEPKGDGYWYSVMTKEFGEDRISESELTSLIIKKGLGSVDTGVMSVDNAKSMVFDKIGFEGKLKELIGDACTPTSIFIYGTGGSGKSGLSLQIADFLGSKNKTILYIAGEQFNTPTFTELLKKTGIKGNNFQIVKELDTLPLANFDVIVIDSKDSVGLLQSNQFKQLRDEYPSKIYIITSQGTKAGNFTGDEKWRNEVDTLIYCENGVASTLVDKNRWGGKASIKIY